MQRLIYMLVLLVIFSNAALAQDNGTPGTFVKEPSNDVWQGDKNGFNENSSNMKRGSLNTTPVNTPIDGGLVVLLSAGVLYGGRQLRKRRQAKAVQ
ncbi:MAG: hypothetical protein EOO14_15610 [Chitinophagaceae bacterium]|nr:MAG: hypothetical protein EOO14_15610 [Chitinophagaceae bacterium]